MEDFSILHKSLQTLARGYDVLPPLIGGLEAVRCSIVLNVNTRQDINWVGDPTWRLWHDE